jgi:putative acyl-CoA dehydrogenase
MRAGVAQAIHHADHRSAFGATLIDQPLMRNVLADLAVESEAATVAAMRLARAYDEALHDGDSSASRPGSHDGDSSASRPGSHDGDSSRPGSPAGDEQAQSFKRISNAVLKYWTTKRAPSHAVECLECLGGNGFVEESGMPRLFRESPLNSIWEGSGNVQCLDVLRAMVKSPDSLEAYFAEVAEGESEPRVAAEAKALRAELTDMHEVEARARRIVERMALLLQGSLLVRFGDEAIADAFCASRLGGDWGRAFGTLPAGTDFERIIDRARAA